jgi:hypothetical protein
MLAYHFFGFLWTLYFIIGVSYVTLAGVFGEYYFKKVGPPTFDPLSDPPADPTLSPGHG